MNRLVKIKWWEHVLLAFYPSITEINCAGFSYYEVTKKRMFGQTFITKVRFR